jgi:hypothetical protein
MPPLDGDDSRGETPRRQLCDASSASADLTSPSCGRPQVNPAKGMAMLPCPLSNKLLFTQSLPGKGYSSIQSLVKRLNIDVSISATTAATLFVLVFFIHRVPLLFCASLQPESESESESARRLARRQKPSFLSKKEKVNGYKWVLQLQRCQKC